MSRIESYLRRLIREEVEAAITERFPRVEFIPAPPMKPKEQLLRDEFWDRANGKRARRHLGSP